MPASRAAEAAARRRMRTLEMAYPAVLDWQLEMEVPRASAADGLDYAASVRVHVAGGTALQGEARAGDELAALRLAFNGLEQELEDDNEGARTRAAQWLQAVRSRLGQRTGAC
jgi:hypothetical protein